MRFSSSGLIKGAVIALFVGILAYGGLRALGHNLVRPSVDDPVQLAREAAENLEKVRKRQPGERRPASYDSVMAPLDKLLRQTKDLIESPEFDPLRDFDKVRSYTSPVIDIATQAAAQARTETGPLVKEYRFNDQKGEACQYLANAMWERMLARMPRETNGFADESPSFPVGDMNELKRVLETGLAATQENRALFYIRGVVYRAEGLFPQAARDLERAVTIDPEFAAAWNVLGLVRISLKEFPMAEEALERAKALTLDEAKRLNAEPGAEYISVIYNLATFHDNLAAYYTRENRINPTMESQRLSARHATEARKYYGEFLAREPAGSPDAKTALTRMNSLPR